MQKTRWLPAMLVVVAVAVSVVAAGAASRRRSTVSDAAGRLAETLTRRLSGR